MEEMMNNAASGNSASKNLSKPSVIHNSGTGVDKKKMSSLFGDKYNP